MPLPAFTARFFPFALAAGLAFSTGCASCRRVDEVPRTDEVEASGDTRLTKGVRPDSAILVEVTRNLDDDATAPQMAEPLLEADDAPSEDSAEMTSPHGDGDDEEVLTPRLRQTGAGDSAEHRTDAGREELEILLGLRPIPPLDIADLLTKVDVIEGLARPIVLHRRVLPGTLPSPYYNNVYFAVDDAEAFGLSLEVWHFRSATDARYFYSDMSASQTAPVQSIGLATDAFYTKRGELLQVVAFDTDLKAVFRFHCDLEGCHVPLLMRFTQQAQARLGGDASGVPTPQNIRRP